LAEKIVPFVSPTIPQRARWVSWRPLTAAAAEIVFGMFCTSVVYGIATQRAAVVKKVALEIFGLGLENFDPVGGWRERANKAKIDASGELPSGKNFTDVTGLKKILVQRQNLFAHMLTDRLLTYACGRRIGALDQPIVDKIVAELPKHKHGMRSLIEAVVMSELFRSL
jgi:hypothetical protein